MYFGRVVWLKTSLYQYQCQDNSIRSLIKSHFILAAVFGHSVHHTEADDVELPPEPAGKCSNKLQVIHLTVYKLLCKWYRKTEQFLHTAVTMLWFICEDLGI